MFIILMRVVLCHSDLISPLETLSSFSQFFLVW